MRCRRASRLFGSRGGAMLRRFARRCGLMALVELIVYVIDRFASQVAQSRWIPLTLLASLSFLLFYAFQVLLEIYSMHPLIIFVPIAGAAAH